MNAFQDLIQIYTRILICPCSIKKTPKKMTHNNFWINMYTDTHTHTMINFLFSLHPDHM